MVKVIPVKELNEEGGQSNVHLSDKNAYIENYKLLLRLWRMSGMYIPCVSWQGKMRKEEVMSAFWCCLALVGAIVVSAEFIYLGTLAGGFSVTVLYSWAKFGGTVTWIVFYAFSFYCGPYMVEFAAQWRKIIQSRTQLDPEDTQNYQRSVKILTILVILVGAVYTVGITGFTFVRMINVINSNDTIAMRQSIFYWHDTMPSGTMLVTATIHSLLLGLTTGLAFVASCSYIVFHCYVICKEFKATDRLVYRYKTDLNTNNRNAAPSFEEGQESHLENLRKHHWSISEMVSITDNIVLSTMSLAIIDSVTFSIVMVYVLAKGSDEIEQLGFMYIVTVLYATVMIVCLACAAIVKSSAHQAEDSLYSMNVSGLSIDDRFVIVGLLITYTVTIFQFSSPETSSNCTDDSDMY